MSSQSVPRQFTFALLLILCLVWASGCRYHVPWPDAPPDTETLDEHDVLRSYAMGSCAMGHNREHTYHQRLHDGRVVELQFDDDSDGQVDEVVPFPDRQSDTPHFVIILDGVPFDVVKEMYDGGHFRLFPPPRRVVSVFPAMTDVALSRVFHTRRCIASEASYFDRERNAMSVGNDVYLSGANAPWTRSVTYLAPQRKAVATYLQPWSVFSTELREMYRLFKHTDAATALAYSVGSAGIGTRGGKKAIKEYLREIENLCERITYDRRGKVRISILADHGHGLERCRRVSFRKFLLNAGFHVTDQLSAPKDVVIISYGLVTYAQFFTEQPRLLAETLVQNPAVNLAAFQDGAGVIVTNANGSGAIRKRRAGFSYDVQGADPLDLGEIRAQLREAGDINDRGIIEDRSLLTATATHKYPDPLHRLWSAFHSYVSKPADVIVSLKPGSCHGSKFFYHFIRPVESTHGSLDYLSSVTFLLSNTNATSSTDILRVEDLQSLILSPPTQSDLPEE